MAISVALARPRATVHALDRSPDALEIARENAVSLGAANVRFLLSDWFSALGEARFDMILANPPYVASGDLHLGRGDLRFEPLLAVEAGADGLAAIRQIIEAAPGHLTAGGWLLLEHGYDQAKRVGDLMRAHGFESVFSTADLAGIERVTGGRLTRPGSGSRIPDHRTQVMD
jgi:release factor glutamine methyltransferase